MNTAMAIYPGDSAALLALVVAVQVAAVVGLAWVISRTLCRRNPAAAGAVWLGALLCVLLAPVVTWTLQRVDASWRRVPVWIAGPETSAFAQQPETHAAGEVHAPSTPEAGEPEPSVAGATSPGTHATTDAAAPHAGSTAAAVPGTEPRSEAFFSPKRLRTAIALMYLTWLVGAAYFAARLLRGWHLVRRLRRGLVPVAPSELGAVAGQVRGALGIRRLPEVACSPAVGSPISLGVLRPVVVLPEGFADSLRPQQLRDVLVHECAHVLHRDHAVGLLQRLAQIVYWLHPAVYVLGRELARTREELCDNHVLRGSDARRYARTLLEISESVRPGRSALGALPILHPRRLEKRIVRLFDRRRLPVTRASGVGRLVATAGLLGVAVSVGGVRLVAARGNHAGDEAAQPAAAVPRALDQRPVAEAALPPLPQESAHAAAEAQHAPFVLPVAVQSADEGPVAPPVPETPEPPVEALVAFHAIGGYSMLSAGHVREELELSPRQVAALCRIACDHQATTRADSEGLATLANSERRRKYATLRERARQRAEQTRQRIEDVLTAQQHKRLEVINLRQSGAAALANDRVLEALGASPEQRTQLDENRRRLTEQMRQLQRESFEEALEVLTPEQIELLKKLHARGYQTGGLLAERTGPPQQGG